MHQVKILRNIFLIFCIGLLVLGCVTNKGTTKNDSVFSISTERALNGIILHFNNIPEDTVHLSVSFMDIADNNKVFHQVQFWDNEAFGFIKTMNELADLRQTRTLLAPFAKSGHEYIISVYLYSDTNLENWTDYSSSAIAGGGIFIINNPSLYFTDQNRYLTLSELPIFSEEVDFSENMGSFAYGIMVRLNDENTPSSSQNWNGLTYPVYQLLNDSQEHFGFVGTLPVVGSVQTNIVYNEIEWIVGVSSTEEALILF